MQRELIISIILIILIFIGDFVTQNYTKEHLDNLTNDLQELKIIITNQEKEISTQKIEEISTSWDKTENILSYFIEHDELEKVTSCITLCQSFTNSENYDLALSELENSIFILDHITDKYSFTLNNIF